MSDLPFLPLWVSTYEAHTAHLSLCEDGAYNRLLRLCWRTPGCTLPADDAWVMRQMRVDQNSFDAFVKPVLSEFFKVRRGRYVNDKLKEVFDTAAERTEKRKSAGRKGGEAKARKTQGLPSSNASSAPEHCHSNLEPELHLEPQSEIKKEEASASSRKREPNGSRLEATWSLTSEWLTEAFNSQPVDQLPLTEAEIRHEADKFRDYWHGQPGAKGRKLDWLGTWRNWVRRAAPEIIRRRPRTSAAGQGRSDGPATRERGLFDAFAAAGDKAHRARGERAGEDGPGAREPVRLVHPAPADRGHPGGSGAGGSTGGQRHDREVAGALPADGSDRSEAGDERGGGLARGYGQREREGFSRSGDLLAPIDAEVSPVPRTAAGAY